MRNRATFRVTTGLAETLNGGVIIDVVTAEEAKIAEDAGTVAVTALAGALGHPARRRRRPHPTRR